MIICLNNINILMTTPKCSRTTLNLSRYVYFDIQYCTQDYSPNVHTVKPHK